MEWALSFGQDGLERVVGQEAAAEHQALLRARTVGLDDRVTAEVERVVTVEVPGWGYVDARDVEALRSLERVDELPEFVPPPASTGPRDRRGGGDRGVPPRCMRGVPPPDRHSVPLVTVLP